MCIECGGDDQDAEKAQGEFLCSYVWGKETLHRKVGSLAFGKRIAHLSIALAREVECLDDVHSVQLLKYSLDKRCLCRLPFRCEHAGFFLHGRCDTQIEGDADDEDGADASIEDKDHRDEDEGIQEAGQRVDENHGGSFLHIAQNSCCDARDPSEAALVKIAHRDALETLSDGDALVRRHEVARMDALQL